MPSGILLAIAALVTLPIVALGQGDDLNQFTPVETRNDRDLSLPFLKLDPRPWVLDKGQQTLTLGFTAANDVRGCFVHHVLKVYEDYENDIVMTRYRKGLGGGADFTIDLPLISRGGGFLDPLIYEFHRLIGAVDNQRNGVPFGQCNIYVPGSGPYHDAIGIGDLTGEITKALSPRLMGTVAAKLPTGNAGQILGSGSVDGAVDLQYRVSNGPRWMWQFQAGIVGQGTSTELKGTRGTNPQAAIVLMHEVNRHDFYVFQWQTEESGSVTGVPASDGPHRLVTVAYQKHLLDGRMLEVFLSDNGDFLNSFHDPVIANIGPEPTIGVRYVIQF